MFGRLCWELPHSTIGHPKAYSAQDVRRVSLAMEHLRGTKVQKKDEHVAVLVIERSSGRTALVIGRRVKR